MTLLAACAPRLPVYIPQPVQVPVAQQRTPPAGLLQAAPSSPRFVEPSHPQAGACLTNPQGVNEYKVFVRGTRARLKAWEAWGRAE